MEGWWGERGAEGERGEEVKAGGGEVKLEFFKKGGKSRVGLRPESVA